MARRNTIDAVDWERAEKFIRVLFETGTWPEAALAHLSIDQAGFKKFIEHHVSTLRNLYSDIDPRHEAAIATMLTHVCFCGVAAGRGTGYSEDEGL